MYDNIWAEFFFCWEKFQIEIVKKMKKHVSWQIFYEKSHSIYEIIARNIREQEKFLSM
jgi:hypothetical protein